MQHRFHFMCICSSPFAAHSSSVHFPRMQKTQAHSLSCFRMPCYFWSWFHRFISRWQNRIEICGEPNLRQVEITRSLKNNYRVACHRKNDIDEVENKKRKIRCRAQLRLFIYYYINHLDCVPFQFERRKLRTHTLASEQKQNQKRKEILSKCVKVHCCTTAIVPTSNTYSPKCECSTDVKALCTRSRRFWFTNLTIDTSKNPIHYCVRTFCFDLWKQKLNEINKEEKT